MESKSTEEEGPRSITLTDIFYEFMITSYHKSSHRIFQS